MTGISLGKRPKVRLKQDESLEYQHLVQWTRCICAQPLPITDNLRGSILELHKMEVTNES